MEPECPRCGSANAVSLARAVESQTHHGTIQGATVLFGGAGMEFGPMFGSVEWQSDLARRYAAPVRPEHPDYAAGTGITLGLLALFSAFLVALTWNVAPDFAIACAFIAGTLFLGSLGFFGISSYTSDRRAARRSAEGAVWIAQMTAYERSLLCAQCGHVFIPAAIPPAAARPACPPASPPSHQPPRSPGPPSLPR